MGPFKFGTLLKECNGVLRVSEAPEESDPELGYLAHSVEGRDARVYTDQEGRIDTVSCDDQLRLHDVELIGLSRDEMLARLGAPDEWGEPLFIDDGEVAGYQQPVEYERLGLQLWLSGGRVVAASCSQI